MIPLQANDRVIKFKVLDGDHVCGQIQLPISQIPRRQEEAYPVQVPLQQHKRCANPSGSLVYQSYVSKFRPVNNNQLSANSQETGSTGSRRGSLSVISSLSSSLTNLTKLRSSSKSGSGRGEDSDKDSVRASGGKAESRRRGELPAGSGGMAESRRRGSQPNISVMMPPADRVVNSEPARNGEGGQSQPASGVSGGGNGGGAWRVYEVEDPEAASSSMAESISMNSNSSLPTVLNTGSPQRFAPQSAASSAPVPQRRISTSSTTTNVSSVSAPPVAAKPVPLARSGPSYGSSAYSSGSSFASSAAADVSAAQPSLSGSTATSVSTLAAADERAMRMSVPAVFEQTEARARAPVPAPAPAPTLQVFPSQYQFQKGHSVHGTGSASTVRAAAPQVETDTSNINFAKRPRVVSVDPPEGSVQGGTKLRICGENLGDQQSDVRAVYICGSNCVSSLFWRSSGELIVTTKPWRECTGFIVVETPHGRSNSAIQFSFRDYKAQPSAPSPQPAGNLPPAASRRRVATANLGLEYETTDTVQVGPNNVHLAVSNGATQADVPSFANPLELTSEICRLRSRVQELEAQNAHLRTDGERLQQYIDSLTQKILSRCPELLCADNGADKSKAAQQPKPRARSSSLFSLLGIGQKEDEKAARKDTIEQLRQFSAQQNVTPVAPQRPLAQQPANGAYESANPSMIMTNVMQL